MILPEMRDEQYKYIYWKWQIQDDFIETNFCQGWFI